RPHEDDLAAGPQVTVLHVVPKEYDLPDLPFDREVIAPELHREVEAALGRLEGAGTLDVREEVSWGNVPAEAIVEVAAREGADLLVLATHGHGAVRRALVGSVASAVARGADRPVLLVPPALWDARRE